MGEEIIRRCAICKVQTVKGMYRSYIVKDLNDKSSTKPNIHVTGNLPAFYHRMSVTLHMRKGAKPNSYYAYDYDIEFNNVTINQYLTGIGISKEDKDKEKYIEEYKQNISAHKNLKDKGISWSAIVQGKDMLYESFSFREADIMHKELVNNKYAPERLKAISRAILKCSRAERIFCYDLGKFYHYGEFVTRQGSYGAFKEKNTVFEMLQDEWFDYHDGLVWDKELQEKKEYIINEIMRRNKEFITFFSDSYIQEYIDSCQQEENVFADEQLNTLWGLRTNKPCIITGGAGVGKTSVVKAIIDCFKKTYKGKNEILLCAPTGKASRRLKEKTGMNAVTIHRALCKLVDSEFIKYHEGNKLPHRLIIVDEATMVSTELMYDLISAMQEHAKLILVGDDRQLFPVDCGEPFVDLLDVVETYKLTINHRQQEGTDILEVANLLRDGKICALDERVCAGKKGISFKRISYNDIGYILLDEKEHCTAEDNSVQFMSPFNAMNDEINWFVRLDAEGAFCAGDKVIMIANTENYCNGDIGFITKVTQNNYTIEIDGSKIRVPKTEEDNIQFAYALTVHKMQGSDADRVIFFAPIGKVLSPRMLYTAITRAKKEIQIYYYEPKNI